MALLSLILVTAALFAWLNHRYIKLPTTIGVMLISLGMGLALLAFDALGLPVREPVEKWLARVDFESALLDVMLAFLLFAGALHVKLDHLMAQRGIIALLATVGVVATTALVGGATWLACRALGLPFGLMPCLLFGALISPTDPIAVLSILKSAGAPKSLETKIAGESLFNDGVGVVLFGVLAAAIGAETLDATHIAITFVEEVGGAILVGLGGGAIAFALLRSVDNYQVEVLLTLALCMGVYSLAGLLHASGPLAVVFAGLLVGNPGRNLAMSSEVEKHIDTFWELIDEILNVVLFVLIGMEVLLLAPSPPVLIAGLAAIPLVLAARFLSVGGTVLALRRRRPFTPHAVKIMTWGGLRGGISVALALSIPPDVAARDFIVSITYVVVVFSIAVQGLTVKRLIRWIPRASAAAE